MKYLMLIGLTVAFLIHTGCRKESGGGDVQVNDSALMYSREVYVWYKSLPGNLSGRTYSDPTKVMQAIREYSIEPGFPDPVDRWSFALKKSEWNNISAAIARDFGLSIFFRSENDLRVSHVEPGSPAYGAGIRRSWRITGINGNTTINTNEETIQRIVNAINNSATVQLNLIKPDDSETNISLTAEQYAEKPVYLDTLYAIAGKKVGYFVYNSFLGSIPTIKNQLAGVFSGFAAENIDELIVDVRYNGGGFVELQNELANYLVPAAGDKEIMLREKHNDKYAEILDTTINFAKKGSLSLSRIFFITTKNSASASELLINSLQPYVETKLVGAPTHGKAVGSFNITVGDWYIFPISFRILNKNNAGNYFGGLPVEANVRDGLDRDWGDVEEACLASALHYIETGSYSNLSARKRSDMLLEENNDKLSKSFKGAVARPGFQH